MNSSRNLILFSAVFFLAVRSYGMIISGRITDENNNALPFVNVYVEGTTIGTTANGDGFYSIDLKAGEEHSLVFRQIGYKIHLERISGSENARTLNVRLIQEAYQLKEVQVKATTEDPAYEIIRKAQKKRKFYLHQVNEYSCETYVKSTQRLTSHPKKILGQEVDLSEQLDTNSGIFYLSESVSKFHFRYPDRVKEIMISSKVSGNNKTFSFNQASDLLISFYENIIGLGDISTRGFVSPIASSAMIYYNYKLEGSFVENNQTINKIKVIPKRTHDPVFQGDIYIIEDSWRIHSTDLFITKNQQIEFLDTLRIQQSYVPVEKETWMNFSSQLSYVFSVFGFHGSGVVLGINSNYNVHPEFGLHFFDNEVLKINKDANKKDSVYWLQTRPVPLIAEEIKDYHKRDSTSVIYESKAYRDSVDKKSNKFSLGGLLLTGYRYEKSFSRELFYFSPLIENLQFNTVEGMNLGISMSYSKGFEDDRWNLISVGTNLRYGFSNGHFNGNVYYQNRYNPVKRASFRVSAGTAVEQFNAQEPISELINSGYSLLAEKNYMKIYEKRFGEVSHRFEWFNGFRLETSGEYADRIPLKNTSDYSFVDVNDREYTSNDPLNPHSDSLAFDENQSLSLNINLRIRFRQEYVSSPQGKSNLGSKYPELQIHYLKGIEEFLGSDVDYDFLAADVSDEMKFGMAGNFQYKIVYGRFLNSSKLSFMDVRHFNGNRTVFSSFSITDYKLLDYYDYSTTDPFAEVHAEHNFGGLILNKIPLIRKLKLNEVGGAHFLHTTLLKNYVELSVGIEKLGIFRIDFVTSFADGNNVRTGFVFGLKGNF